MVVISCYSCFDSGYILACVVVVSVLCATHFLGSFTCCFFILHEIQLLTVGHSISAFECCLLFLKMVESCHLFLTSFYFAFTILFCKSVTTFVVHFFLHNKNKLITTVLHSFACALAPRDSTADKIS